MKAFKCLFLVSLLYCNVIVGRDSSLLSLATGWTVRESNPGGSDIFCTSPDRPSGSHSVTYDSCRLSVPEVKTLGMTATHSF